MGGDGEWMRDEADEDDWNEDDWPDDEWMGDESLEDEWMGDEWMGDEPPMGPEGSEWLVGPGWPAGIEPGYGKRWGHGGVPGFSGWVALAVAVVAAAAGVAAGFLLIRGAPVASATAGATPSASAPASAPSSAPASSGRGDSLPVQPGLPGNANGQVTMLLTGRVLAVSATSITIGGAGPSVTAAVTGATKITGRAHAIGGVKVGDEVAAEITGTPSHLVTITLQDPAQ
jgi:hypothetical protein